MKIIRILCIIILIPFVTSAQKSSALISNETAIQIVSKYLEEKKVEWKLNEVDIKNWMISDLYSNKKSGITYCYVHQQVDGIKIFNAVSSVSIKNGLVTSFSKRFYSNAESKINTTQPSLSASQAIYKAASYLQLEIKGKPNQLSYIKSLNRYYFSSSGISNGKIRVDLVFQPVKDKLILAWDISIQTKDKSHWWNLRFDATTEKFIEKNDWVVHCDFDAPSTPTTSAPAPQNSTINPNPNQPNLLGAYRVFQLPTESPSFGSSVLLPDPSDTAASPYGWHDTNGIAGAEYTITRGNNVFAYDDIANVDAPGFSPDGGAPLNFDFPINFSQAPVNYLSASVTNLFYINNMMHDMLANNGFDEASGNFQEMNYSGQGLGNDYVFAECQDGGGTNNANFGTPDDGQNPTMQMYLWTSSVQSDLTVNSPGAIAATYSCVPAGFGPSITVPITQDVKYAYDGNGNADTLDACDGILNGPSLSGKIALIRRGTCNFVDKVLAAQAEGAVAVIVINNVGSGIFAMGDNGNGGAVTIPSVMISLADGNIFLNSIVAGNTINATLNPPATTAVDLDGSLDNGVVMHEYGHGVSTRLTGGPSNSNCLNNGEEGGEGWSDFFALLFTQKSTDIGTTGRGMGTYLLGQSNSGGGIRRYPYSTDMSIDPETYGFLAQSPEVHDIGEVWCTVLWDLNWAFRSNFGFDSLWASGTSGNNMTLQLVLEGMKLQPCGPGFLDGRDAILAADDNLFGGVHKCLIWETFARRGMGYDAIQGDAATAGDETEGFDLPPICLIPLSPPVANFDADVTSTCFGTVQFRDSSTNTPQSWHWDFGDGDTSNLQDPVHTYTTSNIYTVTLKVTNTLGVDSLVRNSYINVSFPPSPSVSGDTLVCSGIGTVLTASVQGGNTADWFSNNGALLFTGLVFNTPLLTSTTTYHVKQYLPTALQNVGPLNDSFAAGGYLSANAERGLNFTTFVPIKINSVWVDASTTATRTITVYTTAGAIVQTLTMIIPAGKSRINLNFSILNAGDYRIMVSTNCNLYRNNTGATYPYSLPGLVSITSSTSTQNPTSYYYYLYDWEVQELPCTSAPTDVVVNVGSSATSSFTYIPGGLTIQFNNTSTGSPVSILWDFGGGNTSTSQNPAFTFPGTGTYNVSLTVTDAAGCQDVSTQQIVISQIGINEINGDGVSIQYNQKQLTVDFISVPKIASIKIYDSIGKIISDETFEGVSYHKNLGELAVQTIFVSIVTKDGSVVRSIVVE